MTLEYLNKKIDEAIKDAELRPGAMKQTNVLNAEYGLGKIYGYLEIIKDQFDIDTFISSVARINDTINELTDRTQEIY